LLIEVKQLKIKNVYEGHQIVFMDNPTDRNLVTKFVLSVDGWANAGGSGQQPVFRGGIQFPITFI
jgi:hypothetical protein